MFGFDDDVFEDFVDGMAKVDLAIGVGWAVVEEEQGAAFGMGAQLCVEVVTFPTLEDGRFTFGEVATHGEVGRGQMQGGFVVLAHAVARNRCSERMWRACWASRCICAVIVWRSGNVSSSRSLAMNSTSIRRP